MEKKESDELNPQEKLQMLKAELKSLKEPETIDYEYRLCGVVVHYGTAEFGHYYSYINTNRGNKENILDPSKDKWLEYNDSMIRSFNIEDLDKNCFGGESQ